jgi:hypothetical protein
MSYTSIPLKQTSNFFGTINKVIWFDVADIKGNFTVNLYITPNQDADTNIVIFNKETKETVFSKTYKKTSLNTTELFDPQKIKHVPGFRGTTYGIRVF